MRTYQVEVDEEVFSYVQRHAEPLVDDFNSTIKRLLGLAAGGSKAQSPSAKTQSTPIPGLSLPREVPQSLRQILEVAYLVSKHGESRTDATRIVARSHRVAPQTVLDKYCRQLDLTAAEFDRLLDEPKLKTLRKKLQTKFGEYITQIDNVLFEKDAA
jgi:hypothetical protein